MVGWADGWMDRWLDGQMVGWIGGKRKEEKGIYVDSHRYTNIHVQTKS